MLSHAMLAAATGATLLATPVPADDAPKPRKDPMICKASNTTSSRIRRETCKLASQWQAEQDESARDLQQARDLGVRRGDVAVPRF